MTGAIVLPGGGVFLSDAQALRLHLLLRSEKRLYPSDREAVAALWLAGQRSVGKPTESAFGNSPNVGGGLSHEREEPYTTSEFARLLGVTPQHTRVLAHSNGITSIRRGRWAVADVRRLKKIYEGTPS